MLVPGFNEVKVIRNDFNFPKRNLILKIWFRIIIIGSLQIDIKKGVNYTKRNTF